MYSCNQVSTIDLNDPLIQVRPGSDSGVNRFNQNVDVYIYVCVLKHTF